MPSHLISDVRERINNRQTVPRRNSVKIFYWWTSQWYHMGQEVPVKFYYSQLLKILIDL